MVIEKTGLEYERPAGFNHDFEPGSREHIHFILSMGQEHAHWKMGVSFHEVWLLGQYIVVLEEMSGIVAVESPDYWDVLAKLINQCGKESNHAVSNISSHGIWLFKPCIESLEELLEEKAA